MNNQIKLIEIEDVSIAFKKTGTGNPVIFIHGFPTFGYTWRKIVPEIAKNNTCYVLDLPGLGNSRMAQNAKVDSTSQAEYVLEFIKKEDIKKCSIIAHNSGATIARIIAIQQPKLIDKLILINTEIPNHRPPWIPFYQKIGLIPLAQIVIRKALKYSWFVNSSMAFKEAYSNKSMFENPENLGAYIYPITLSKEKTVNAFKYLKGIDWKVIDSFKERHKKIKAKTLLIWGEDDKTFPIKKAEEMIHQFNGNCKLIAIKNASLLPHEEKSEEILFHITPFLQGI
jgi:pimeloyl-ACP methyl ester carboxylesterase